MRRASIAFLMLMTAGGGCTCNGDGGPPPPFVPEPPRNPSLGPPLHSVHVLLHSGQLRVPAVDLQVGGNAAGLALSRTYRSGQAGDGLLGPGWYLTINRTLDPDGDTLLLGDGTGLVHRMTRNGDRWDGPPGVYAVAEADGSGRKVTWAGGEIDRFDAAGRLVGFDDAGGRANAVMRDADGRPSAIVGWTGERMDLAYDADGLLTSATTAGRTLSYLYDEDHRLARVLQPAAPFLGPPDANGDRAEQPPTRLGPAYEYDEVGRLATVRDALGDVSFTSTFDDQGRVASQTWAGGSTTYEYLPGGITRLIDRRNHAWEYRHDDDGHPTLIRQVVGGQDRDTVFTYNPDGEVVGQTLPSGRAARMTYEQGAADPRDRGNLLELSTGPAEDTRITRYTYTRGQQVRSIVPPRGNDPVYLPPTPGPMGAERYRTTVQYEVDELEETLGVDLDGDGTMLDRDLNGDGRMGPARNLPIVINRPARFDFGGASQPTREVLRYDDDGLLVEQMSAGGTLTTYAYGSGDQRGLLLGEVIDAGTGVNPVSGISRANRTRQYTYDGERRLVSSTSGGRTILYTYDERGLVATIGDQEGATPEVRQRYDANGRLVLREVDRPGPGGALDASFPVRRERLVYDDLGLVVREELEVAPGVFETTVTTRDVAGNALLAPVREGAVLDVTYGADGEPLELRSASGAAVGQFQFDADGRMVELGGDDGRARRWTYDAHGQVASQVREDGVRIATDYDPDGNAIRIELTGAAGSAIERRFTAYDELGRPIEERRDLFDTATGLPLPPGSMIERFHYDQDGNASTMDRDGTSSHLVFDGAGRMAESLDPSGNATSWRYDVNSNLVMSRTVSIDPEAPGGTRTEEVDHVYDAQARLLSSTDEAGRVWSFEQGDDGPLRAVDPLGHEIARLYDGAGRVTAVIASPAPGEEITVSTTYDQEGRIVSRLDDNGNTTGYQYDDLRGPSAVIAPDGTPDPGDNPTSRVAYGPGGRIATRTDASGTSFTYSYDQAGRMTRRDIVAGPGVVAPSVETYTYDAAGRLTGVSADGVQTVSLGYDSLGRITSDGQPLGAFSYRYVGGGQRTGVVYPSGTDVAYTRDAGGRVVAASAGGENLVTYTYAGADRLLAREVLGVGRTDWSYQGAVFTGEPTRITHRMAGAIVADHTLGRDLLGALTSDVALEDGGAADSFAYDGLGRLVSGSLGAGGFDFAMTLDGASNRTNLRISLPGGEVFDLPAAYGPRNQLVDRAGDAFAYDANGNRVSGGNLSITYDHRNRPVHIVDAFGGELTYGYDGLGRRVSSVEVTSLGSTIACEYAYVLVPGGEWSVAICEDEQVCTYGEVAYLVCVADGGPPDTTEIVYGHGEGEGVGAAAVMTTTGGGGGGGRFVVFQDAQGSPQVIAPEGGGVLEHYRYDPDGSQSLFLDDGVNPWQLAAVGDAPSGNGIGWKGFWRGAPWGFLDARTRDYDPNTGRFVQPDSRGDWADEGCLGNGYCAFRASSPNSSDPFGTWGSFKGDRHGPMTRKYLGPTGVPDQAITCVEEYNRNVDDSDSHASHQGLNHFEQLEYHGQVADPVPPIQYTAHIGTVVNALNAAIRDKNCTEVTHQYGELLHAAQDVNSHRGMSNPDHILVDPDDEDSPSFNERLANADTETGTVATAAAAVHTWMADPANQCHCCEGDDVSISWSGFLFVVSDYLGSDASPGYVPRTWDGVPGLPEPLSLWPQYARYAAPFMVPAPGGGYRWTAPAPPRAPNNPRHRRPRRVS